MSKQSIPHTRNKSRFYSFIIAKNSNFPGGRIGKNPEAETERLPGFVQANGRSLAFSSYLLPFFYVFYLNSLGKIQSDKLALFPSLFFFFVYACFAYSFKKVSLYPALYYYFFFLSLTLCSLLSLFPENMLLCGDIKERAYARKISLSREGGFLLYVHQQASLYNSLKTPLNKGFERLIFWG